MSPPTNSQPDIKLVLDEEGVIREATVSGAVPSDDLNAWIGCRWEDTVGDLGREQVVGLLNDAREAGVAGFQQVSQLLPAGLEIPVEYTAVWLGAPLAGAVAIGKSLQTLTELQSRLIAAQQALERDHWKLRDVETRYRQLFEASNEAVVVVRARDLCIVEANQAAVRALGLASERTQGRTGKDLLACIAEEHHETLSDTLARAREMGKRPGVTIRLGQPAEPWIVHATYVRAEPGATFLLQLAPAPGHSVLESPAARGAIEEMLVRAPEPFVVTRRDGSVEMANSAFAALVHVGSIEALIDRPIERWFARPATDLRVLVSKVCETGSVKGFPSAMRSQFGIEQAVEVSAFGDRDEEPQRIAYLIHNLGPAGSSRAATAPTFDDALHPLVQRIGSAPMRRLVRETVDVIETHFIRQALERTGGNRTGAAELLGLSRQSLYAKLSRYGIDPESD